MSNQYTIQRCNNKKRNKDLAYIMGLLQENIAGLDGAEIKLETHPTSEGYSLPNYVISRGVTKIADISRGFRIDDKIIITILPEYADSISPKEGATMQEPEPKTVWQRAREALGIKMSRRQETHVEGAQYQRLADDGIFRL